MPERTSQLVPFPGDMPRLRMIEDLRQQVVEYIERSSIWMAPLIKQHLEAQQRIAEMTKPLLEVAAGMQRMTAPMFEDIARATSMFNRMSYFRMPPLPVVKRQESIPYMPKHEYMRISPVDREAIIEGVSLRVGVSSKGNAINLIYDRHEKTLSRVILGKTLVSSFTIDAKRLRLFEELWRAKGYVSTKELCEELECPSGEAIRKLVQCINKKIKDDLDIPQRIITGRPGFGYRINPGISIHQA